MKNYYLTISLVLFMMPSMAQIQSLQKLGQLSFPTSCAGVWHYVDNSGREYALLGNGNGIVIVEVTVPANPTVLFTVPAANSLWREIKTYSHYAYAGTEGGGGITIIDLSGLPSSYLSKTYTGDGPIAGLLSNSHTVQIFGDYLYIFGSNLNTVICSLADPWNPQYVGTYAAHYVHDGYVLNDTLYASEVYNGQFSVVDVTDKANPVVLASQPTPGAFNHNCWFSDNRQYLYTTDEQPNSPVGVFDVSDISDIRLVGTYYNDSLSNREVHNVRVINDFLINPSYGSQLTIYDGARPQNLIEIARYPTGNYLCWDASPYLPSGNIIATDMDGEFYVFAPYYVRACYLEGKVTDLNSGLPINGSLVKILGTGVSRNSDLNGDYRTGYPTSGTFDIEFSKPGYLTKVVSGVALNNGVLTTLDVQLEPFSVQLQVIDGVTLTGIPFANVRFQNSNSNVEFTADANGQLTVSSVYSAAYEITAGKWGYRSQCISTSVPSAGIITLTLNRGYYDDFTFDFGWTVSGDAVSGIWVRGEPIGTTFGTTAANPEFDSNLDCSDQCYMTGNGGGSANNDDVDDGTTTLSSPVFDITSMSDPYLNYESWFYQQFTTNHAIDDTMFVKVSNGTAEQIVDVITGPSPTNSTWVPKSKRILDFITLSTTMQVIVSISDKVGTGNPLEGAIDKFEISEGPTGLASGQEYNSTYQVFPNPFQSQFSFTVKGADADYWFEVTDITGRLMVKKNVRAGEIFKVDGSEWKSGVYFVNILNGGGNLKVIKLVKY